MWLSKHKNKPYWIGNTSMEELILSDELETPFRVVAASKLTDLQKRFDELVKLHRELIAEKSAIYYKLMSQRDELLKHAKEMAACLKKSNYSYDQVQAAKYEAFRASIGEGE